MDSSNSPCGSKVETRSPFSVITNASHLLTLLRNERKENDSFLFGVYVFRPPAKTLQLMTIMISMNDYQ